MTKAAIGSTRRPHICHIQTDRRWFRTALLIELAFFRRNPLVIEERLYEMYVLDMLGKRGASISGRRLGEY
jgi:hypothetical protein